MFSCGKDDKNERMNPEDLEHIIYDSESIIGRKEMLVRLKECVHSKRNVPMFCYILLYKVMFLEYSFYFILSYYYNLNLIDLEFILNVVLISKHSDIGEY